MERFDLDDVPELGPRLDEPDDAADVSSPSSFLYEQSFAQLRLPIALLAGGILLASCIFYGLSSVFAKPPTFELAGPEVQQLKVGDPVLRGNVQIGNVQSIELHRGRWVAHLAIDREFTKSVRESPNFRIESMRSLLGASTARVRQAGADGAPFSHNRLLETPGQFTHAKTPSLFFLVAVGVVILAIIAAGLAVLKIAQSIAKFVGMAIVLVVVAVVVLFLAGQLNLLG